MRRKSREATKVFVQQNQFDPGMTIEDLDLKERMRHDSETLSVSEPVDGHLHWKIKIDGPQISGRSIAQIENMPITGFHSDVNIKTFYPVTVTS